MMAVVGVCSFAGFELQVLEGAEQLLAGHNVWYIIGRVQRRHRGKGGAEENASVSA